MIPEGALGVSAPEISPTEAVRLGCELYDLGARSGVHAERLPGEYDANFRLVADDGRPCVLKVMHPARDLGFIDLQCSALRHLAESAPHLPLPRVARTLPPHLRRRPFRGPGTTLI